MAGDEEKRDRADSTMEVLLDELEDTSASKPARTAQVRPPPLLDAKPVPPKRELTKPAIPTPALPTREPTAAEALRPGSPRKDSSIDSLLAELDRQVAPARTEVTEGRRPPTVRRPSVPPAPRAPGVAGRPTSSAPSVGTASPASAVAPQKTPPRAPPPPAPDAAAGSIEAWERELATITDPAQKGRLHFEIARLHELRARDFRRASQHYQDAIVAMPEHVPSIQGARRALLAQKAYREALPLFDAEARITSDARRRAALRLAKGRVLEDLIGLKSEARAEYVTALELDRGEPAILKALEQCDAEAGAYAELAKTYERSANAVGSDARHRATLIVTRARILELRQKETDAAIELYETALRLDPDAAFALEALERLYHGQKRFRDLVGVLERKVVRATDPSVRAMALHRIAHLHADRLGNRGEATSALERAVALAPDEPVLLEDLVRFYEASDRPADLASVLERLAARSSASRFDRVELGHRIGTIREEKLDDEVGAIAAYESVLALDALHLPTLQALTKLYQRRKDHGALLGMLLAEAEASIDPRRRAAAHARVAEIYEVVEKKTETAIEHHARALTIVVGYAPSFKALTRLYAQAKRWRELVALYARAVDEAGPGDASVAYLMKMGALYEDALGEPGQAVLAYRRVLTMSPGNLGAIHAMQRAAERAERPSDLVEALELEITLGVDPKAMLGVIHRAGEVLEQALNDREGAIARYRRALAIDGSYAPALASLGRLFHRTGRWEDLLELYERELNLANGASTVVALRLKMGELCEARIGRDDEALRHYRAAAAADPRNGRALDTLARKLRERGAYEELAQVLELSLTSLETPSGKTDAGGLDPRARARAAHRIAEVQEERLANAPKALALYELARDLDPTYRPAIDAIARLRSTAQAFAILVDELEREARGATDEQIAISAWLRAGEVAAEHLAEPKRAIACFDQVLELAPGNLAALLALEQLTRRVGALEPLARVLASLSRTLADPPARVAALRELARLQETRLPTKPADLRTTYETILSLSPDDPAALSSLERIALETGDRALLATIDARIAERATDPTIVAAHKGRLAETLLDAGDPRATAAFLAAIESDPESIAAARGLRRAAESSDQPKVLADALRHEARLATEPRTAAALLVRAGAIARDALSDTRAAYLDFERALELDPDEAAAAAALLEILIVSAQAGRAVDRLGRAALSAQTPERIRDLSLEVARLQADLLSDVAGGISTLSRAQRAVPGSTPLLLALARLLGRDGQWAQAAEKLGAAIDLAPSRETLRDAHLDLAVIELDRLGDLTKAGNSLGAALALSPDSTLGLSLLARLERRAARPERAADALRRLIAVTTGKAEKAAALVELSRVEQERGDGTRALDALHEAVALEGPYGASAKSFRASLASTDEAGWSRYAQALYDHLRRAASEGPRALAVPSAIYVNLAEVLSDTLNRHGDALEVLREAVRAHGDDPELARRFAQQALRAERPAEAVETLRKLVDAQPALAELQRDLGSAIVRVHADAATVVLGPLAVLGVTRPEEDQRLRARGSSLARVHREGLTRESLALLYRMDFHAPALGMIAALPEALVKLYPPDLEGLGVGRADRLTPRGGHPIRVLADRIAALLSAGEFELYTHRVRGRGVAVELSEPVSILVPLAISEMPEAGQIFLLARALANAALGLSVFDKLTPRELEVMLASAARVASPRFGAGLTSEEILEEQNRRIARAISRKARRVLDEIAPTYVGSAPSDLPAIARSVALGAARTGALLADDLREAVEALRRTERDYASGEAAQLVASSPIVGDLARFWTSDVALDVRRRAGLL